jgi:hypothetical protein
MKVRSLRGVLLGSVLLLIAAPSAAADPEATAVPGLSGAGEAILRGADDAMWIAEPADPGAIARVTTTGAVTEFKGGVTPNFTANRRPSGLAVTPEGTRWPAGTMWFLMNGGSDELGRITTGGAVGRYALTSGRPTSLTGGPDGQLWMTVEGDSTDPDAIARLDTVNTVVTNFTAGLTRTTNPRALTSGPDGALWFMENGGSGRLGRLSTSGQLTWHDIGGTASALASGPLGALWLARGATVMRADDLAPLTTGGAPNALAGGPDGALWAGMTGAVARIEPGGAVTVAGAGLPPGARVQGIAAGADGRMWMTLDRSPYLVRMTVPPLTSGGAASATSPTTATLSAAVTPNGLDTDVRAELQGPDGTWTALQSVPVGAGTAAVPVTIALSGLAPARTLRLRVAAGNAAGTAASDPIELTTPAAAGPVSPAPPAPQAAPVPVQGETVVLTVGTGTIRFKAPGQRSYTTLDGASNVPVGSLIDSSAGSVVLASRVGAKTQRGTFHGGTFRVGQARRSGLTELTLAGALDCSRRTGARASAAAAKKPKPKTRRVWGQDSGGSFRTSGRSSVATVRGTRWLTQDTCSGTLVRVREGAVSVKPTHGRVRRATLVRAGHELFTPR